MSSEQEPARHVRHRPPITLEQARPLILAVPQLRSGVNLSRLVRLCGCCGVQKMIVAGNTKIDPKIARDAVTVVRLERHRSLDRSLIDMKNSGFRLVGLEQTDRSLNLHHYRFDRETVLVAGTEREGMDDATIRLMDDLVEIPVYGLPYSYNVVTATTMAMYEYCRQFPAG